MHSAARLVNRQFLRNLAILGGGEALTRLISFVALAELARRIGPGFFGYVEVAAAVGIFLTVGVERGTTTWGICQIARDPQQTSGIVARVVAAQAATAMGLVAIAIMVIAALPLASIMQVLLGGYCLAILGVPLLFGWAFQGRRQMHFVAIPAIARQTAFAAIVLFAIHSPDELWRLPIAEGVAVLVAIGLNLWLFRRAGGTLAFSWREGEQGALTRESLPIGGSQLIWAARMYFPTVLLALMASDDSVGRYGAAHRLVMVFLTALNVYFINLLPTLSEHAAAPERLAGMLRRSMRLVALPAILLALATPLAAPALVGIVWGSAFVDRESVAVLCVLIWVVPVFVWRNHSRSALLAVGRQRDELVSSLAGIGALLLLAPMLTALFGAVGMACSMLCAEFAGAAINWKQLSQRVPGIGVVTHLFLLRGHAPVADHALTSAAPVLTTRVERDPENAEVIRPLAAGVVISVK